MDENEIVTDLASTSSSSNLLVVGVGAAVLGVVGTLATQKLKKKLAERKAAQLEAVEG
jgi:hypothetical protein